jgi:hypothetical protein
VSSGEVRENVCLKQLGNLFRSLLDYPVGATGLQNELVYAITMQSYFFAMLLLQQLAKQPKMGKDLCLYLHIISEDRRPVSVACLLPYTRLQQSFHRRCTRTHTHTRMHPL